MEKKTKKVFLDGAISAQFIAESIQKHSTKKDIGAHSIFLGQVRHDKIEGKHVAAIEYSAYTEMAENKLHDIREDAFAKFNLTCMHMYHSLGRVDAGEICLFVFTSSAHREAATQACQYLVERIKNEVAIWGKEIFEDGNHTWKINK